MRINDRISLRHVAGENIFIMQKPEETDMTRVVSLNETSLWLYNELLGRDFDTEDVCRMLMDRYEVEQSDAEKDVQDWVRQMKEYNLILD